MYKNIVKYFSVCYLFCYGVLYAQNGAVTGFCTSGATPAVVSGLSSTNKLQGVISSCRVTVYLTGTTTLATIYTNSVGTTLPNPFTANQNGQWLFYAATTSNYDVVLNGGIPPNVFSSSVTITGLGTSSSGVAPAGAVSLNPESGQTVNQPTVSGAQTELTVNALNGWRNSSAYPGGTSTATQVQNAINSLYLTTGSAGDTALVGPITIPSYATPYNGDGTGGGTNPMLTSIVPGATCWDFRVDPLVGWVNGGSVLYPCDDWTKANASYKPGRAFLWVGQNVNLSSYPNDLFGPAGFISSLTVTGASAASNIQANDANASELYLMPGLNTSISGGYSNAYEANATLIGATSGTTPGTYSEMYDVRGLTANIVSQNVASTLNNTLGHFSDIVGQPVTFTPPSTMNIGGLASIWAQPPGVAYSSLHMSGTAAFVNTSGTMTYASGNHFNDEAMVNHWIKVGSAFYTVTSVNVLAGTATIYPVYSGTSGTYTWTMQGGDEYGLFAQGSSRFDTGNFGTAIAPLDPRGGGGVLFDLTNQSAPGGSPIPGLMWLRQPALAALQSDGTYPRMALGVDNYGNMDWYKDCTVALTGSISGTTLTVTGSPTGACALAVGQIITPSNNTFGTNSYGVITALGTGTGGAGTYTLSLSNTVSSTSLLALGVNNIAALATASGGYSSFYDFTVTGGFIGVNAPSQFGPTSFVGAVTSTQNISTTAAITGSIIAIGNGSATAGCATVSSLGVITSTGTACGGGGSSSFSSLTSGTNTTAAMLIGSGASFGPTGTGTVSATSIGGVAVTGTPTTNYVLTATSPTTATWQAAAGGISGLTLNCLPRAGSATTLTSNSALCDNGTTLNASEPITSTGTGISVGAQMTSGTTTGYVPAAFFGLYPFAAGSNSNAGFAQDASGSYMAECQGCGSANIIGIGGQLGVYGEHYLTFSQSAGKFGVFTYGVKSPVYSAATLYSAAGTPLPTCNSSAQGDQRVVSDALSPLYMTAYTSGGAITASVICSYNGTTYSWLTH